MRTRLWTPLRRLGVASPHKGATTRISAFKGRFSTLDLHLPFSSLTRRFQDHGDEVPAGSTPKALVVSAGKDSILARARDYGITTTDQLLVESSFGLIDGQSSPCLVDRPPWAEDFDLWIILLDFQRTKNGDAGVRAVFRAMSKRCGKHFPFLGRHADYLWDVFLSSGTRDLTFLRHICKFEYRQGAQRPDFLVEVVGKLLESPNAAAASSVYRPRIRSWDEVDREDVIKLFLHVSKSGSASALGYFCKLYEAMPRMHIYPVVIPHLVNQERLMDAWLTHSFLLRMEDLPQGFEELAPLVVDLAQTGASLEPFLRQLEAAGASFEAQVRRLYDQERARYSGFPGGNLNIVASRTFGVQPKVLSDDFAARAFATTSFSFEFVLNGLRLLGLRAVGPLSIREIAVRAAGPFAVSERFARLQELGIDTGSSAYVRLVKALAANGQHSLLKAVLDTDQHHDVFEDLNLQCRILDNYHRVQDWPGINRTLAILNSGRFGLAGERRSANFLLQAALRNRDWRAIFQSISNMHHSHYKVNQSTVKLLSKSILSPLGPKFNQNSERHVDELAYYIALLQDVLKLGGAISPLLWREPIRRLGMQGRWRELQRTLTWVAAWYTSAETKGAHVREHGRLTPQMNELFGRPLQQAMISWSFIHMSTTSEISHLRSLPGGPFEEPWLRGTRLLRELNESFGIPLDVRAIQATFMARLRQLFSIGGYSKLFKNRRLRMWNSLPLTYYVSVFYRSWNLPLARTQKHHIFRSTLETAPIRPRDAIALHLLKRWEQHNERRRLIASKQRRQRLANSRMITKTEPTDKVQSAGEVVVYRDLFNASYKDYKH